MEISIEIEKSARRHVVKGIINIDDLQVFLKEKVYSSPEDKNKNVLWDLQEADFTAVSSKDLMTFIDFVRANWGRNGEYKAAIVVSQELGYELARMYEVMLEQKTSNPVEVFRDIKAAERWLGL